MADFMPMLLAMLVWHAIADYPLQGDFLAKAKNRFAPIPGVPWAQALGAHALIHAGGVWLITGSLWLALAEFVLHAFIDYSKCYGSIGFNTDQSLHVGCKVAWAVIACV
jgi:hypothetical protein